MHERGFVLVSTRSPDVQRMYFQCSPTEKIDGWSDDRIWAGFKRASRQTMAGRSRRVRFSARPSSACAVWWSHQCGTDACFCAAIPPTSCHLQVPKDLNLAASDAQILARAFTTFYKSNRDDLLDQYSTTALRRVWKATRFSWWFTSMMHSFPGADEFQHRLQVAELDYVTSSKAGATALAENYVGLAIE